MKSLLSLLLGVAFFLALPCEAKSQIKLSNRVRKTYADPRVSADAGHRCISRNKSCEHSSQKVNDKIYIKNVSAIKLFPNGIAVWKDRKLYVVSSMHSDEHGLYVQKKRFPSV